MSDLEKAARQALEALSRSKLMDDNHFYCYAAATALRQALEQPKHEWVGLPDDNALWEMWAESSSNVFLFARAIENKLKEKNA